MHRQNCPARSTRREAAFCCGAPVLSEMLNRMADKACIVCVCESEEDIALPLHFKNA